MYDSNDEESEFWSRVPDGRMDRFRDRHPRQARSTTTRRAAPGPVGSRAHQEHHTGSLPVVAAPVVHKVRGAAGQVDPLLRRAGVLAVVVALLVPVALSLRSESGASRTAAGTPGVAAPAVGAADTGVPADAAATPVEAADPFADIDVNALPPAVPAHPDTTATRAKAATTTEESTTAAAAASTARSTTAATTAATAARATTRSKVASTTQAAACAKRYTIRSGDAWISLAQRARVTLKALLAANGATSSTSLYPGRTICLPAGARTPTSSTSTSSSTSSSTKPTSTTAKPQPKPGPVYTPPAKTYTKDQVRQIIRDVWPDNLEDEAIRIATRESNLVPTARNFCCYGLFQIYWSVHRTWLASLGITSAAMLGDPRINAYAAYVMYLRSGGWGPWT